MKKLSLALVGLAAVALSSCSSDEPAVVNGGDGVTFTVSVPQEALSRASFDSGLQAENLVAAAYTPAGEFITSATAKFNNSLNTQVTLALLKGRTYNVVFWAQNDTTSAYTLDLDENATTSVPTITVDYDKMNQGNDQAFDCFYKLETVAVTANMPAQNVVLTRPLAQINVGTSDLALPAVYKDLSSTKSASNIDLLRTSITTKGYKTLDLLSGAASNEVDVNYKNVDLQKIPSTEAFPVDPTTYAYLAMVYVLENTTQATTNTDVEFFKAGETTPLTTISIPNLPLQRNYRTNIYGQLLTNSTEFNVTKDPIYNTPSYDLKYEFVVTNATDLAAAWNTPLQKGEKLTISLTEDVKVAKSLTAGAGTREIFTNGNTLDVKGVNITNEDAEVVINGAGGTLKTENSSYGIWVGAKNGKLEINNATLEFAQNGSYGIYLKNQSTVNENMEVTLNDVTIPGNVAVAVSGGCVQQGEAGYPGVPVNITVNNSTINAQETGINAVNEGNVVVKNSTINAKWNCIASRCSNVTLDNVKLNLDTENCTQTDHRYWCYDTGDTWAFGGSNNSAIAAICLGQRETTSTDIHLCYAGNVTCDMNDVTITVTGNKAAEAASIYAVSHRQQFCHLNYNSGCQINAGKGCFYYHSLWDAATNTYPTDNVWPIVINGVTMTQQGGTF